jgi:predicted glycoside hydrolase/deacetylase ChbG (UPF0249 family)
MIVYIKMVLPMKRIILCADDYGQNNAISQAIIELLEKNRLSATSCLTTYDTWETQAKKLYSFKKQIDIGLHFNLTQGKPLSKEMLEENGFYSHRVLLLKAYSGQLNKKTIRAELNAQIDQFIEGLGQEPDFIDGHQHIHQLPRVRDVLLEVYKERALHCYIRSTVDKSVYSSIGTSGYIKRCVIQLMGASSFQFLLEKKQIPHNTSFSGVYAFSDSHQYSQLFMQFLCRIGDNGIIMCHPGLPTREDDEIGYSRPDEYRYLLSPEFQEACELHKVTLSRWIL